MKLYHPRGVQVTFPIPLPDCPPVIALQAVSAYLDAGWLVAAPGLVAGEERKTVSHVVKGSHEKDGEVTPTLLLYAADDKFSFVKVFLNTSDDIAAFEHATRTRLTSIPEYIGNDKPERGKSQKTDSFIYPLAQSAEVVFKANPDYNPDEKDTTKKKPARKFIRWADQRPKAADSKPASNPPAGNAGGGQSKQGAGGRPVVAGIPRVTEREAAIICDLIDRSKTSPDSFRRNYDITRVLDLPVVKYQEAVDFLNRKIEIIQAEERKKAEANQNSEIPY